MKKEKFVVDEEKMFEVAKKVLFYIKEFKQGELNKTKQEGGGSRSTLVALSGDLGAGKTTFSQKMALLLGVEDQVTSPTYVIEKVYHTKDTDFPQFIHIDAYRLDTADELTNLGFNELLSDSQNLIFIEWPERVKEILPKDTIMLRFTVINESTRQIEILNQLSDILSG